MPVTTLDPLSALVVVDLQAGVVGTPTQPYPAADVVARSARLADTFRAQGRLVVLVRVTARPDGADTVHGRSDVSVAAAATGQSALPPRPAGWDVIVDELGGPTGKEGDVVVTKRNWGAFYGTDLDVQLRRRGITQVVITGVATSIGVESAARQAHEHAVTRVFPRLAETGTTEEILALLGA